MATVNIPADREITSTGTWDNNSNNLYGGGTDFNYNRIANYIPAGSTINSATAYLNAIYWPWGLPGFTHRFEAGSAWTDFDFGYSGSQITLDVTSAVQQALNAGTGVGGSVSLATYWYEYAYGENATYDSYIAVTYTPPNVKPNPPSVSYSVSSPTNAGTFNVNWGFSDPDGGDYQTAYQIVGSNNSWASWGYDSGKVADGNARSRAVSVGEGNWQFAVSVWDSRDVWSDWGGFGNIQIDRTPPTVSGGTASPRYINVQPNNTFQVEVTVTDNLSGVSIVRFPTAGPGYDFQWRDGVNRGGGRWTCDIPISAYNNNEGQYETHVYAYDNAGNVQMVRQVITIVDRTPPTINSVSPRQNIAENDATVTVNLTEAGSGMRVVYVDIFKPDGAARATGLQATNVGGGNWSSTYNNFDIDGNWSIWIYPRDNADNGGSVLTTVFRDTVKAADPNPTVSNIKTTSCTLSWNAFNDPAPSSGRKTTDVYFGEGNTAGFTGEMKHSGGDVGNITSLNITGLKPGTQYRYTVTYHDNANLESNYVYKTFRTNVLPSVTITSPTEGQSLNTRTPTVQWSFNDPEDAQTAFLIELVDGAYSTVLWSSGWISGSQKSYTLPAGVITADSGYFLRMLVRDQAGEQSGPIESTNRYFISDTTPPIITSPQGYSYTNQTTGNRRVWIYGVLDTSSGISMVYFTAYNAQGAVVGYGNAGQSGSDWYADVPLSNIQGEWYAEFQAQDRSGNTSPVVAVRFFVDSVRANDPNPSAVWGQTNATILWGGISDPPPSSGYMDTKLWLGEWDGSNWVGAMLYNGNVVATDSSVTTQYVSGLTPGKRYRYTVAHYDKADNQSAYTWREFVTKKKIGEMRMLLAGDAVLAIPIYDPNSGVLGNKQVRITTTNGSVGCFEIIPTNDQNASPIRVITAGGIKSISK